MDKKSKKLSFRQKSKTKLVNLTKIEKLTFDKNENYLTKSNLFNLLDKNRKKTNFYMTKIEENKFEQNSKKITIWTKIDFFLTFLTKI